MNRSIIINALRDRLSVLKHTPPNGIPPGQVSWEILQIEEALKEQKIFVSSTDLSRQGGKWLGIARTWMQRKFRNGDNVHWSSQDPLQGTISVFDIEELAASVVAAALNERIQDIEANLSSSAAPKTKDSLEAPVGSVLALAEQCNAGLLENKEFLDKVYEIIVPFV